ncbi:MAG: hypothetical protein A2Z15_07310, partial [Chloroflexi bacterium RBG_16_50_11]
DKDGNPESFNIIARDITERKQAEAALLESQQFNATLLEHAPHAAMVINPDTSVKYVNPAWEKLNGWTLAEIIGTKPPYPWWPDQLKEIFMNGFKDAMKQGSGKSEIICQKKNGEIYWIDMNWVSVRNNGKLLYLIINSVDITERIKSQEALRESESKYRSIFESANDIIILMDREGKIIDLNNKVKEIAGYEKEEFIGRKLSELTNIMSRSSLAVVVKNFSKRFAGVNVPPYDIEMYKKNGELINFEINAVPLKINEKITGDVAILRDITHQKRSMLAIKESEEKFSKAFRSSPEIIAITTIKEGKYIEVNDSYVLRTGYSREELIGNTTTAVHIWANEEDRVKMSRMLEERGKVYNEEFDFRMKSGEIRTWLISLEPITIGGEPCLIGVSLDITERKRMEKALRESEEKFAAAFHSSPDMMVIISLQSGKFIEVNETYVRFTGYSHDELIGHTMDEFNLWVNKKDLGRIILLIKKQGRFRHEELQFRTKSGGILTWLCSADIINVGGQSCILAVATDITQRRQTEKALRESEEKFAAAFHSSPNMIIITDVQRNRYLELNDTYANTIGYTREELMSCELDEIPMWANPGELKEMTHLLQTHGKVRNMEYSFRKKTGEMLQWLCSAEMVTIGGRECMLAVATDITERKKFQEALRESEEKFSKAFHASPFSISISRLGDGKFIEVNETFLRDKGYTRKEIIGRSSKEFSIWADDDEAKEFMKTLKEQGRIHNVVIKFHTKAGDIRTGLVSAETININNEPYMLVVNNDITQQKQAEEQLRLLSSVTRQVSDAIVIADPSFNITFINHAAQGLFGYSAEEIAGKSLYLLNDKPPSEKNVQEILKTTSSGKTWKGLVIKKRKDGSTFFCDCRVSPMYDEKGTLCSYIDVQRDVTKQKEVETKLQEHKKLIDSILATMPEGVLVIDGKDRVILANKALHKIFHLNNRSLKNKLLNDIFPPDQFFHLHKKVKGGENGDNILEFRYQTPNTEKIVTCVVVKMDGDRKLLSFTDISKEREKEEKLYLTDRLASIGEMAAGIAHELNNPLTGILALSQLLMKNNIPEECKEDLECIQSEAKRATAIVKNVLLFARNKTGESGQSSVNETVKDILKLREYEERISNVTVVTNLEENLPDIPVDKWQLQQVFLNLISNAEAAIKETSRPGIITIATQRVNNHINIMFSDNGCGIKKQIMPRIFDPFFTTKEIGKGTGLGLSICYSLIVKHGGKISVKSQVNEGTTFTIRMPVVL